MDSQGDSYFNYVDYLVFGAMLVLSTLIGVYFAFFATIRQNTTSQYLMGGKTMGIFPVSMSLIASYISGISLLGMPAEVYTYGTQFWMIIASEGFVIITICLAYLPVFFTLQITSSYEYLNLRFSNTVRLMGSILFLIKMMLYIPIVIYVPALAFSQVTGFNLHLITPIVCVVCIFYTTLNQNTDMPTSDNNFSFVITILDTKHVVLIMHFEIVEEQILYSVFILSGTLLLSRELHITDTNYISGISLLGIPAEIYTYGTQYWMTLASKGFVIITICLAYLPVFYTLQITSSYEYLNLRFSNTVRLMGSILFLIKMMLYIPIVIYVPALAFSQVSGINLHLITPVVCVVCIFYTTLGGLKAVVWTDTMQTIVMFGGLIIVFIIGTMDVGGFGVIFDRNEKSDRLEFFNMNPDPTIRHTFWTVSVGNYFSWLASCSVNQAMVQRCLSMPTLKSAYITVIIMFFGIFSLVCMSCFMGLLIFATYYDCDPVSAKQISKSDQLLPYYVLKIANGVPGLAGMFISGVFSAALSSMSTGLNSMTGVIYEDLIKPRIKTQMSEGKASFVMKIIVFIIGCICVGLVFLVEKLGMLIQASASMGAITAGPLLGLFTLGMFFPTANEKGALFGGICGLALVTWISIGTQVELAHGNIVFPKKPVSVEGCNSSLILNLNDTIITPTIPEPSESLFFMYQISYMYYTAIGAITVISVGLCISHLTGCNKNKILDKNLFTPIVHKFLKYDKSNKNIDKKEIKMEMTIQK